MRSLAAAWPDTEVVPQAVGQLPWGHVRVLLDKLSTRQERDWYAVAAGEYGWSRDVLVHQVETGLAVRVGSVPRTSRPLCRRRIRSWRSSWRYPYVFDHLALSERVVERELEQALMDRLQDTLLAFGHGMAFVGRQVRFDVDVDVDVDELVLDLLLFNVEQLRYVVVELKIGRFDPAYVGQHGTYVAVVDDRLRRIDRRTPTVGILLCKERNDTLVRYALAGAPAPLAVADYTYDTLPVQERGGLPTAAELAAALEPRWAGPGGQCRMRGRRRCCRSGPSSRSGPGWCGTAALGGASCSPGHRRDRPADRGLSRRVAWVRGAGRGLYQKRRGRQWKRGWPSWASLSCLCTRSSWPICRNTSATEAYSP